MNLAGKTKLVYRDAPTRRSKCRDAHPKRQRKICPAAFALKPAGLSCILPREEEVNHFRQIAAVAVLCTVAAVRGEAGTLNAHRLAGGEYVAASELAKFYGLGRNQSGSSDRADYRTSFARLSLQTERREIQINGAQHWLSAPVLNARGQLWISSVDVLKDIDPVLRQGRSKTLTPIRTVVLDPGHGGGDRGTRGRSTVEKQMTLDVAKRVERDLEAVGVNVLLTRTSDRTLSLEERVDFADTKKADLFVSIHFNSGGSADGIETYCLPPAGAVSTASSWSRSRGRDEGASPGNRYDVRNIWLAHCVHRSLLRATDANDRGVRRARFYVLRYASCPAILVEAGFLTNRAEEQRILTSEYRERLAKAIADGIMAYKSSVEKS
jgi:N-acetylmuramoyl-L-alanine amidase